MFILKNCLVAALLLLSVNTLAVTESPITSIENPDFVCESTGALIAIRLPDSATSGRVWTSDPGQSEGLELQNLKFIQMRRPNTWTITGTVAFMGQQADYVLKLRGQAKEDFKPYLTAWMNHEAILTGVPCQNRP